MTTRTYNLRGIRDEKGRPVQNAECRAYNATNATDMPLVEIEWSDADGSATFTELPSAAPVDIEIIYGEHTQWITNVFNTDGSALETAVTLAHTQNTDTALGIQTQNLNMNSNKIVNVTNCANAQDAATKAYVDAAAINGVDLSTTTWKWMYVPTGEKLYLDDVEEVLVTRVSEAEAGTNTHIPQGLYITGGAPFLEADAYAFDTDTADHTHTTSAQGGTLDHGTALTGLTDNDHPQYLLVADIDDTPVNNETAQPVSSNWAFDHNAKDATASIQGHATVAQITKLDAIEAAATKYPDTGEQAFLDADHSKLDGIATGANLYVHPNHSGEVTSVADGAQTIANDAVTYAKMQNVSAADKVLGRSTTGAGDVEEIVCTAAGRALLDDAANSDQRTTLGLGTMAVATATDYVANSLLTERGSVIFRNATVPAELKHGNDGEVLTTKGDGADPIWATGGNTDPMALIWAIVFGG